MKAIILAAGLGDRCYPLTKTNPKILIELNSKSLLEHFFDSLSESKIKDIIIVLGYLSNKIKDKAIELNVKYDFNLEFIENKNYSNTNNIVSLNLALDGIDDENEVLLLESDLYIQNDSLVDFINFDCDNCCLVSPYQLGMDGTVVEIRDEDNLIQNFIQSSKQGSNFNYFNTFKTVNIYKFKNLSLIKKVLSLYSDLNNNLYYESIFNAILNLNEFEIYAKVIQPDNWIEIDTYNDYEKAKFKFEYDNETKITTVKDKFGSYWNYDIEDKLLIRNSYFPTKNLINEIKNNLEILIKSYSSKQENVDRKLANYLRIDRNQNLITLNGVSQIYPILKNIINNESVLIPKPTFGEYKKLSNNIDYYDVRFGELQKINIINSNWVVIVNPNNPTGTIFQNDELLNMVYSNPNINFIIDESFIDFSSSPSIFNDIIDSKNVLYLKSLGKYLGIPGIRLGFAYSNNLNLLNQIRKEIPIWNINSISEYIIEVLPRFKKEIKDSIEMTKLKKEKLKKELEKNNLIDKIYDTETNFLVFKKNDKIKEQEVLNFFLKSNIIIKSLEEVGYFRIGL